MSRLISRLSISHRLASIVLCAVAVLLLIIAVDANNLRDEMLKEKRTKTKEQVQTVTGILDFYYALHREGKLTEPQAKMQALKEISSLRYADNDYFWINDMAPTMVMHPIKSSLDGKSLRNFHDPQGKAVFVEMVETVRRNGGGFVDYLWPKPGNTAPIPKISYVQGFKPWGWVVGSGIYVDDVQRMFVNELSRVLLIAAIASASLVLVSITLARSITRPLEAAVAAMSDVAVGEGDLTKRLDEGGNDELAALARQFNTFVNKLQGLLKQVANAVTHLNQANSTVSEIINNTGQGVERQHQQTDQVATAVTELNSTAQEVAEAASRAADAAHGGHRLALDSHQVLEDNHQAITRLNTTMELATKTIQRVEADSDNISTILETIRGIAGQTNLLALNAAIEAARAGEQGRGFAVVADEVRSLARRTEEATGEIETMITTLQDGTKQAVNAMLSGHQQALASAANTEQTGKALRSIATAIDTVNDMNTQIATAAEQQVAVVGEINRNIVSISGIGQETASGAQHAESAVQQMHQQLTLLMALLQHFKLTQT